MDPADGLGEPGRNEPTVVGAVDRELRAPAAAGVAGLVFVILFVVSIALLYSEPPRPEFDSSGLD
jgi:hypothetical protein